MSDGEFDNLVSDPKRQAVSTQRGYAYQAWQSVYQWITLPSGEVLFLEGAEDIDILKAKHEGNKEATTIQVKDTRGSGSVTLNSGDVLEAIGHFWEHQHNNPSVIIRFHFLTTSDRGHEQGSPFGTIHGLDYWDDCKRSGTDLGPLRSFLRGKDALPSELRDFLSVASDEELRAQLIRRILWDTGNEPQPYLGALIERILIDYGVRVHSLTPAESLNVIPHLFKRVWDVVCQNQDRRLDYTDFARLFEEVTTERIGSNELRELRRAARLLTQSSSGTFTGSSAATSLTTRSILEPITPPTHERLAARAALVSSLHSRLLVKGVLVLKGSTGMGKSTLASLIVGTQEVAQWRRLDMRGLEPERVRERLFHAATTDAEQALSDHYVIDDLNFSSQTDLYENALAALIYVVRKRGGLVIITTQGELPHRIRLLFDLPEDCSVNVPLFTEEDVREVAVKYNCPTGEKLDGWLRIIVGNTGGHPLLVHARIKNLESAGWPAPEAHDIFTPESVEDVRREVRRRFQELLPSDAARTLAYRLSILTDRFKRNHALYLGQSPPPLANSGEAFDLLVGPWVERLSDGYYRLSPLLGGSAEEMTTPQQKKDLHRAAAESYLTDLSWTPRELFGALFHGLIGEALQPLVAAINSSLNVEGKDWTAISRQLDIFAYMRLKPGEVLLPVEPFLSITLRWLQFRVAAEIDPARLTLKVVERWAEELEGLDESYGYPGSKLVMQFTFATLTLLRFEVPLPMRTVARNLVSVVLSRREGLAQDENPLLSETFTRHAELWGDTAFFVTSAALRCKSKEALDELLSALAEQRPEATQEIWGAFRENDYLAMLLIDPVWLNESKEETPDWLRCLEVLDKAARMGIEHQAYALTATAYRARAIIFREYLEDSSTAHAALDEGRERLGQEHVLLRDYRAKILFLDKQFGEALAIWESVTPELEVKLNPSRVFSYRDAEISAASLNDWGRAAGLALAGEEAANRVPYPDMAVGFHADRAFALWMAGERASSVSAFAEVLRMLRQLSSPDEDIKSYLLHRKVSHAIAWLKQDIKGRDKVPQPPAGWFSDPSVEEERGEQLQPDVYFWYHLAQIEYACGTGDAAFTGFEEASRRFDLPHVRASVATLRLQHLLRKPTISAPLVEAFASFVTQIRNYSESKGETRQNKTAHEQLIVPFLFAALCVRVPLHILPDSSTIDRWGKDAKTYGIDSEPLYIWLDFLKKSVSVEQGELITVMKGQDERTEIRLLAALLLSADESIDPENLFYANVVLVTTPNAFGLWQEDVEFSIGELLSAGWQRVIKYQRFALRSPNLNVPAIQSACADASKGLKKGARVLLAARNSVQIGLTDSSLQLLKALAREDS